MTKLEQLIGGLQELQRVESDGGPHLHPEDTRRAIYIPSEALGILNSDEMRRCGWQLNDETLDWFLVIDEGWP